MCGIAGILLPPHADTRALGAIHAMTRAMHHRGPDGEGIWTDPAAGVALGHRRLAIVDLSDAGRQPMLSHGGRLAMAFNGEIYNFRSTRSELEELGQSFRGHSDTEVMLAAIETRGVEAALTQLHGMFAFALWDRDTRSVHLGRDRLGKKPLYVALHQGALLFASELKALRAFPGFAPGINRGSLTLYLRHGYIPDPYTIYEGTIKLPPASVLTLCPDDLAAANIADVLRRVRPYWSALAAAQRGQSNPLRIGKQNAADELERCLRHAVAERMVADVPLGAFLSGGIDSSTVVALMQAQSNRPVRTFTIGFERAAYDEAKDAKRVADYLGTDHTELYVTTADVVSVVPTLPEVYDEPFADASQIPTYLVSRLARSQVTVALSGDGGDESFGGYNRHTASSRLAALYQVPRMARSAVASCFTMIPPALWDVTLDVSRRILPPTLTRGVTGEWIHKIAGIAATPDLVAAYWRAVSHWCNPAAIVVGGNELPTALSNFEWQSQPLPDITGCMMYLDSVTYLPGDILVKVDRASMAVSLEMRCPLLDHRVVELAWRLPPELKVRDGQGKWLLREVLARYLPRTLFERPKQGFGGPLDDWLKGPLRDWADTLLAEARLKREGFLDPIPIRRAWAEHLSGARSHSHRLWIVLMFQAWLARWHGMGR